MSNVRALRIRALPEGREQSFNGRFAWALSVLIGAGERGATPIDHPGPRWSHYVHKLRRAGLEIETIAEEQAGPYPGHHGRYVLRTAIEVVSIAEQETTI